MKQFVYLVAFNRALIRQKWSQQPVCYAHIHTNLNKNKGPHRNSNQRFIKMRVL